MTTRLRPAAVLAVSITLLFVTLGVRPAAAIAAPEDFVFEAQPGAKKSQEFPPVVGITALSDEVDIVGCETLPTCTLVNIRVKQPPGYDPEVDEYLIKISVEWLENEFVLDPGVKPYGQDLKTEAELSDLDLTFYKVVPTEATDDDPSAVEAVEIGDSATARMPETFLLFGGLDHYQMAVYNTDGQNLGFTVTAEFIGLEIPTPTELLDGFGALPTDFESEPGDVSGSIGPGGSSSSSNLGDRLLELDPTGGLALLDADPFADLDVANQLGGSGAGANSLTRNTRRAGPPGDVGGLTLLMWFGVVPALAVFFAVVFLLRRRPAALSMSFPARATG